MDDGMSSIMYWHGTQIPSIFMRKRIQIGIIHFVDEREYSKRSTNNVIILYYKKESIYGESITILAFVDV